MSKRWIEAFRIGGKASRGIKPEHLAEVVDDDFDANPRALCFGHPKSDDPAAGTISGAKVEGNSLMVEVASLTQKAVDGIKSGEWLNRSAAFFDPHHEANPRPGKWTLRHVGLLGAAAPGIPNMTPLKALAFSAEGDTLDHLEITGDPAEAVVYAGAPTPIHTIYDAKEPATMTGTPTPTPATGPTAEELAAQATKLAADQTAFAARVRNQFEASNASAIDGLVLAGKVLPAEADGLKLAFNAFDPEADELTFGAGDKATKASAVSHLFQFMATALGKRVPIGTERLSPGGEFNADENAPKSGGDFNALATARAKEKNITFDAAAEQIAEELDA